MPRTLHIDADPGCDDAIMLAMALGLDELDLVGVSTVAGNTTIENATRNAGSILALGEADVPVARGCGRPIEDDLATAEWVHGEGGLRGDVPEPATEPVDVHGADFIVEQAREYGDELVIAAVGPFTNLALALAKEPALPELVDDIWLMGGAAFTTGNVTPAAEANVHNDPVAASRVFQDARPKMVGLDVTDRATVPLQRVEAYRGDGGRYEPIADWLDYPDEVLDLNEGGPAIHDAVVTAALADPAVLDFEKYYCEVDTTGGPSHGGVVCDERDVYDAEPNVEVAVDIDVDRYRELLYEGVEGYVGE